MIPRVVEFPLFTGAVEFKEVKFSVMSLGQWGMPLKRIKGPLCLSLLWLLLCTILQLWPRDQTCDASGWQSWCWT